jgi:phage terminase large subunit
MYFTCNPGGIGHIWVKRLFIDRDYKESENPEDYTFIKSLVYDNEFIMTNDPGYVKTLENLPEDRRKAMLYGDWDIFEGQYFTEFNREVHVIDPFVIPDNWNRYLSIDYGLDMLAVVWIAVDTQNKSYVYKELYESNLIISEASKRILEVNGKDKYIYIYAPPDLWNRRQETGMSAEDIFKQNGVTLKKSNNNRVQGWYAVKENLKIYESKDEQAGNIIRTADLKIFKNCTNLIRCIPQVQHDERDGNDVANEPHEITHINDALRGYCIERTQATKEKTDIELEREQREKYRRQQTVRAIGGRTATKSFMKYGG